MLDFRDPEVTPVLKTKLMTDFGFYTRYMFKSMYGRPFIFGDHHRKIAETLEAVARGDILRLIINIPPRYGKCISLDTDVLTASGLKKAKDIVKGDMLYSFKDGRCVLRRCLGTEPARKRSVRVFLRSGRQITCSFDHPLLSTFGYVEAEKLKIGDRLVVLRASYDGTHRIPDAELDFITMMIFDGYCGKSAKWSKINVESIQAMKSACEKLEIGFKKYEKSKCDFGLLNAPKIRFLLKKYGIYEKHSYDKRVPRDWFTLDKDQRLRFIDLMFATDGYANKENGTGGIALANRGLIDDIQAMLSSVGIVSNISYSPNKCRGAWKLTIPRGEMTKLIEMIPFTGKRDSAIHCADKWSMTTVDSYPYSIIPHERLTWKTRNDGIRCESNKEISQEKFKKLISFYPQLKKYVLDDFFYDRVDHIAKVGEMDLLHLSVEDTHNFIANGIVSHNTEEAVRSFMSWGLANNPSARFMHLSFSDTLVMDNSEAVRDCVKSDVFRTLFPETVVSPTTDAKDKWYTTRDGGIYAVSTGGQITGFGAGQFGERIYRGTGSPADGFGGAIIIDDPLKPEDAFSDTLRERINARYNHTIRSRVNDEHTTPVIVIMQRIHDHDMAGFLIDGGSGDDWTVLKMPAIKEDGTPLWPEKHTISDLEKIKRASPETFAAQYMQDPMVADGNIFKKEWFRYYTPDEKPTYFDKVFQSWDLTFKATKHTDFVSGTVWGLKGPMFFLLDRVHAKMTFTETLRTMLQVSSKWPDAIAKYVEAKANGEAAMDMLNKKVMGIIPVTPGESKISRAHAVTPLFEAGNVLFPKYAPWLFDYEDELTKFPNAEHDDDVDSTTQALSQNMDQTSLWDMI